MNFYLLLKIWIKILVKYSKSLSGKQSQKLLVHAKQLATDALKASSNREIQKTAEAIRDLIGNKMAIKLQKCQKIQNRVFKNSYE